MEERYRKFREQLLEKYGEDDLEYVELEFIIDALIDNETLDGFFKEVEPFVSD